MESLNHTTKLKGVRVLVIGGTSGIGFGVVEALVEYGAYVFVSSSSIQSVETAVERLRDKYPSAGSNIEGYTCDLASSDRNTSEVENLFNRVTLTERLDHVVFTAGDVLKPAGIEEYTFGEMQQAGMVRFFGPLIIAQHLSRALKNNTSSSFIITTGGLNRRPRKGWTVIMSYLAGLEGMTRALAVEMAPIRVNAVGPGPTNTERWSSHRETADVDALKRRLAETTITKQLGAVEDVAESYIYLMKDRNTTGSILYTNGGALLV